MIKIIFEKINLYYKNKAKVERLKDDENLYKFHNQINDLNIKIIIIIIILV